MSEPIRILTSGPCGVIQPEWLVDWQIDVELPRGTEYVARFCHALPDGDVMHTIVSLPDRPLVVQVEELYKPVPVPEPASLWVLAVGVVILRRIRSI